MSFKNNLKNNFFIIDEFENKILNNYLWLGIKDQTIL
jgi:hypothetical protein